MKFLVTAKVHLPWDSSNPNDILTLDFTDTIESGVVKVTSDAIPSGLTSREKLITFRGNQPTAEAAAQGLSRDIILKVVQMPNGVAATFVEPYSSEE